MPRLTPATLTRPRLIRKEEDNPFWWLRWVPALTLTGALLYFLYLVGRVAIIPVLTSFALAYLLNPIVVKFQKHRFNRGTATFCAMTLVTLSVALFLWLVIPDLWHQSVTTGEIVLNNFTPEKAEEARKKIQQMSPMLDRMIGYRVYEFLKDRENLLNASRQWVAGSATDLLANVSASLDLLIVPFFVYYILVDFGRWRDKTEELIPPRFREPFTRLFDEVGRILQSYVLGQLMIAMLMGLLYAVGFYFLHVPAWAGLAMLSGFLNVIPYVGTGLGIVLASGFTFANGGGIWRVAGVLGTFTAVQSIEGYYLTPRILGERLSLHPMSVFLGLLIGGKLFGFLGVLLAVPVIAVAQVFLKFIREIYKTSFFYHAGEISPEELPREPTEVLAKAADTVLTEQVEEQKGDELLAPEVHEDDPAAREKLMKQ